MLRALLLLLLVLLLAQLTYAGEPPTAPVLRIDPGEHTAKIGRIASDAAGRWLVSASDDKTARVWEVKDGRLLATLRPPLGAGNEGKLFAVAMSPDGGTLALGGGTNWVTKARETTTSSCSTVAAADCCAASAGCPR